MLPFASNLKKRAEALGLSNAEVARRAGLTERRYGNYVTGRREPDLKTLVDIARVLHTSVDVLLAPEPVGGNAVQVNPLSDRLSVAAASLSESDLELLVVQAEAVAAFRTRRMGEGA